MEEMSDLQWRLYKRGVDYRGDLAAAQRLAARDARLLYRLHGWSAQYIRNVYDFDCAEETEFWYVVRDRALEIEEYPSKKDRQQIRRSLRAYEFKRVDMEEMRRIGYRVYLENWLRFPEFNRPRRESEAEFEKFLTDQERRGVEFWVGYSAETGEAAMWESVHVVGKVAVEDQERLSYRYKQHYPTYGLNHVIANHYLQERGVRYVVAGARSVTEHSNVQEFLLSKMGFRKAYCRLKVWLRFPISVIVPCIYPFRKLLPRESKTRLLLMLMQYARGTK